MKNLIKSIPLIISLSILSTVSAGNCGGVPEIGDNPYPCCWCEGGYPCNEDHCHSSYSHDWNYGGNCTWYAWQRKYNDGDPLPGNWGNAGAWASKADNDPNWDLSGAPALGAIACNTYVEGYGHVAYVVDFNSTHVWVDEQLCCYLSGVRYAHQYSISYFDGGFILPHSAPNPCGCGDCDCADCCVED